MCLTCLTNNYFFHQFTLFSCENDLEAIFMATGKSMSQL
jgi:hypothetical protein